MRPLFSRRSAAQGCTAARPSNDALRKHGILPPREPTPPTPPLPPSPTLEELLDDFSVSELRELGDESKDDETERAIDAYRRKRKAELRDEEEKSGLWPGVPHR